MKFVINCGSQVCSFDYQEYSHRDSAAVLPGKTDSEIKGYIRQKLQNESKRLQEKATPS